MARRYGIVRATAVEQAQKEQPSLVAFEPLPAPTGAAPYRLSTDALGVAHPNGGPRVFHVIGDHGGVLVPTFQQQVADAMVADLAAYPSVGWCYSVGDVVYFFGSEGSYAQQFYEPYVKYGRPIVAIPGNHDGAVDPLTAPVSLAGFVENFCALSPTLDPAAEEYNRDTMTQPNVYWTLDDPAITIVGLYSNVPSGGAIEADQVEWFEGELDAAPEGVPLIVALHHPPYSCDEMHGGSAKMGALLDASFAKVGRYPNLVLAGHVHNYQRFTRTLSSGFSVTYIVCGGSGYHNLHAMAYDASPGLPVAADTTLAAFCADQYGFLRLSVTSVAIAGEYVAVAKDGMVTPGRDLFSIAVP